MKKIFFFIPIIFLIFATTITKNSTKQLDRKIFEIKENIRVLKDKYELEMLEYNYLTSPKKLIGYQKLIIFLSTFQILLQSFSEI